MLKGPGWELEAPSSDLGPWILVDYGKFLRTGHTHTYPLFCWLWVCPVVSSSQSPCDGVQPGLESWNKPFISYLLLVGLFYHSKGDETIAVAQGLRRKSGGTLAWCHPCSSKPYFASTENTDNDSLVNEYLNIMGWFRREIKGCINTSQLWTLISAPQRAYYKLFPERMF